MCTIRHRYWVIGRSLIRTFLADATKDATISSRAMSKLRTKSWVWIWLFQKEWLPLHPMMSHNTAGGSPSGVHWKQFIAECGIEYGRQFVTPFSFNPTNCLYTKKSWEFLQSYEKTSEMQKENFWNPFLFLPRRRIRLRFHYKEKKMCGNF